MVQPRYQGKLKKWNTDRGFGFITADDGGQDVFVHISAFARDGSEPVLGESLSFDIEPDRNGKRSAVRVRRADHPMPSPSKPSAPRQPRISRSSHSSCAQKLVVIMLLFLLSVFGYNRYANRVKKIESAAPQAVLAPPASPLFESKQATPTGFSCDGRTRCSQMTSCKEAKFFLQNCPDVKMDGNHDGVPCEQHWCKTPFSD